MKTDYVTELRSKIGHMAVFNPVVTLVIYKDGKVLLQKRTDNGTWAIHGGAIEPGEKYIDALYREIKEELNIEPINPQLMGIFSGEELYHVYEKSKDAVYALNHVFICENYNGEIEFTDGEVGELKWFDIDNLPDNVFKINKPILSSVKEFIESGRKVIVN